MSLVVKKNVEDGRREGKMGGKMRRKIEKFFIKFSNLVSFSFFLEEGRFLGENRENYSDSKGW